MKRLVATGMFLALCSSAAFAGFDEGKTAYDAKDYATALKEWQPLADAGDARAQGQLARMYYNGFGVTQDKVRAASLARAAAEKNEPYGQNLLGLMMHHGEGGIEENIPESVNWFRKAAMQGLVQGQVNLGIDYWEGHGVKKDRGTAEAWFRKAAEQGNADGEFYLGRCYVNHGIRDFVEGNKWYRKAAIKGHSTAQFYLGQAYNFSVTRKELQRAIDYEEADELGDWQSISQAVPRDLVIAYVLFTLSARGGESGAVKDLAKLRPTLSAKQIAEGDAILAAWKPGQDLPIASKTGAAPRVVDTPPTGKSQ